MVTATGDDPASGRFSWPESDGSGKKKSRKFWKCFLFCYSETGEPLAGGSPAMARKCLSSGGCFPTHGRTQGKRSRVITDRTQPDFFEVLNV